MESTWASGAIELLSHADSHIDSNTAFDKRIAFISVDNSVENIVRTFLSLPKSKSGINVKRREIDEAGNSFPRLLEILYKYAGEKLVGIDDADIEHYHRIRNTLYHQGTGLSVDDQYLKAYRGIAEVLLLNLFNASSKKHIAENISLENLVLNWNKIEQLAKSQIEQLGFTTSFKWEEKFAHSYLSEESVKNIAELRKARNKLVHSTNIDKDEIKYWVEKSEKLLKEIQESTQLFMTKAKPANQGKNPVCFISYSWDSEDHNAWVRKLAERLQQSGVNTILDQWDLRPGMDIAHFMEKSINDSDYVLLICTPHFAQKANEGTGGVGYEKNIVTTEIFKNKKPDKSFVPILRVGNDKESIPSYLGLKRYIDFRIEKNFSDNFEELLRHIYEKPKFKKPTVGVAPFLLDANSEIDVATNIQQNISDSLSVIDAIALNWANQNYPYFIVEGLQDIQKAFIRHPPKNIAINDFNTLAFLLLCGFHYGGNWCFWLDQNRSNELISEVFISCFSVSYKGPLYRALYALQLFGEKDVISFILSSNNISDATKKLIELYVIQCNVMKYLATIANEDKGTTGQRAMSVLKEIKQFCIKK